MTEETKNKLKVTVSLAKELVREINTQRAQVLADQNVSISFSQALENAAWKGVDMKPKKAASKKRRKK